MTTNGSIRGAVAWLTMLVWSGAAGAQPPDETGKQLKVCVELTQEGRYEKAVGVCLDALDHVSKPDRPRIHKVLGFAYWKLKLLQESWHHLTLYLESSGKQNATVTGWLQKVETKLKKKHVKVTLACAEGVAVRPRPPDSGLRAVYTCPLTWWFVPGTHKIQCEEPGDEPSVVGIDKIAVKKVGDPGVRGICGVSKSLIGGGPKPGRTLEWALIGSGAALTITGAVFQVWGNSDNNALHSKYLDQAESPNGSDAKSRYDEAYDDQVRPKMLAAYVLYGVGGAALVGGIVTWMVRKPGKAAGDPFPVTVAPLTIPDGTGAMISLEW